MQSYDYSKLLGLMRERGFTQEKLAKTIGISECSMNFSLNNKRNFRQDEISKISGALGIPVGKIEDFLDIILPSLYNDNIRQTTVCVCPDVEG